MQPLRRLYFAKTCRQTLANTNWHVWCHIHAILHTCKSSFQFKEYVRILVFVYMFPMFLHVLRTICTMWSAGCTMWSAGCCHITHGFDFMRCKIWTLYMVLSSCEKTKIDRCLKHCRFLHFIKPNTHEHTRWHYYADNECRKLFEPLQEKFWKPLQTGKGHKWSHDLRLIGNEFCRHAIIVIVHAGQGK